MRTVLAIVLTAGAALAGDGREDVARKLETKALHSIGRCHEALGNRDKAIEAYRRGAACDEEDTLNRARLKELEEKR